MIVRSWVAAAAILILAASSALAQQKTIKDPAEYNAYIAALKLANPSQKAAAMVKFVASYPKSVVKQDALEQAMAAYQQAGDQAGVEKTALGVLALDPKNVRTLAVATVLERAKATQGDKQALAALQTHAQRGLAALAAWKKPNGVSDADFAKLRAQMSGIFNGAAAFAAMQTKDYSKARAAYLAAVKLDASDLQNVYQLGVAELQMTPLDPMGFWHIARAINMAKAQKNDAGAEQIERYGRVKFGNYHHILCNFDLILTQAAKQADAPADFAKTITPVNPPAAVAVQAVKECKVSEMSFDDFEYILGFRDASPANKDAAGQVWAMIQSMQKGGSVKIQIPVKVVAASAASIDASIVTDAQRPNTADVRLTMASPLAQPPAAGATIAVRGVFTDYAPSPFLFLMKDGEVVGAK